MRTTPADMKLLRLPLYRRTLVSRARMRLFLALPRSITRRLFHGIDHYCPVCESHVRAFQDFGYGTKSWCPVCASMKRHRLAWLFLARSTDLFDGSQKRMLHVAPEPGLARRFRWIPNLDYLSADLYGRGSMVRMDITKIRFPDNAFDVIYCSHVMEHIQDDRRAIHELARVLKPDGWAIFMVPLSEEPTNEDPSISTPAKRERVFGQFDHVRQYGPDFKDRLAEGFEVAEIKSSEVASREDTLRMGLPERDSIFFCAKKTAASRS